MTTFENKPLKIGEKVSILFRDEGKGDLKLKFGIVYETSEKHVTFLIYQFNPSWFDYGNLIRDVSQFGFRLPWNKVEIMLKDGRIEKI